MAGEDSQSGADLTFLQAEVIALQGVLIALCRSLSRDHPELGPSLCRAFDEAETLMAGVALQFGLEAPQEVTLGAVKVIEEMRTAVIRDESMCEGRGA